MGLPTCSAESMTAKEFFAFTETRPDDEKWELIEGKPILNASASQRRVDQRGASLNLPALAITLPLAEIYRDRGLVSA